MTAANLVWVSVYEGCSPEGTINSWWKGCLWTSFKYSFF